jgi:type IX secretion system PorP/SprF family membrane protein
MKKIFLTVFLSAVIFVAQSQQDAQFSMNNHNKLSMNPGYAGIKKALCVTAFHRQQWVGFDGHPTVTLLSVDYGQLFGGGIGLTIDQDEAGMETKTKAKLAYSYHTRKIYIGTLGIGIDVGMIQQRLGGNFLAPTDVLDPSIPLQNTNITTYDVGFGLYYKIHKTLYVGLSALHLPAPSPEQITTKDGLESVYNLDVARTYYLMAGYTYHATPQWDIEPSILAKSVLATTQIDINVIGKYRVVPRAGNVFYAGTSYRINDAVVLMAGMEEIMFDNNNGSFKFGYSYDVSTSSIKDYDNGSHEIMIGICYKIKPDKRRTGHMNMRFLGN